MPSKLHSKSLAILAAAGSLVIPFQGRAGVPADPSGWPPVTAQTRPWTRWWWMGSAVDAANLDRELARYHDAGLGGVEVTPIYGVKGWESRDIPYLSPKWMEMLDHAIATGMRLGMKTDMTTGTGWCFGGPTVSALDANAALVATTQQVAEGASPSGKFDPATTQALMAFSANGKCVELTSMIDPEGKVGWTAPDGMWAVYSISQKPSGMMVKRSAPGGAGPMLNPFYPQAITDYMQWFEQPFAAYQPKLDALFQDSYEYVSDWSPDFFARFEKLRGYRLQTELPALLGVGSDDHVARVKSDYRETISDIMTDDAMPVWVRWAHAHGYLARYQAHGDPGNLLDLYAIADVPETEMFFRDRNILVSKFASSAAHVTGKPLASAETGTWLEEHFTGTLADVKQLADDMFLAGINHIVYHGTAYSPDEAPWPGWCFYASTEMNPRNSIWRDVPTVNAYITRCQSILQAGKPANDVLVYWPIFDKWNDAHGMVQQFDIKGAWFKTEPIGKTAQLLWDRGYGYDYVSDRQISALKVDPQTGGVLAAGGRYKAIVVPPCHLMPETTLEKLFALSATGVPVIFDGKLPDDVPGWGDLAGRRKELEGFLDPVPTVVAPPLHVTKDVPAALEAAGVHRESMVDHPGIEFVRRSHPNGYDYFIANRGTAPLDDWITLSSPGRAVEVMDPMTGQLGLAEVRAAGEANPQVRLQLDAGHSIILHTSARAPSGLAPWAPHPTGAPVPLTGTWSVKFIQGGPALPAPFETGTLASWTTLGEPDAQAFAGTALYSLTFDAPSGINGPCTLDLGEVCQSARVRLNGRSLGTLILPPWRIDAGTLLPRGNRLEVEVTNVSANRIRDLDIRHVPWKIFYPPNVLSVHYTPLDASGWHLTESGLIGPVSLIPAAAH